MYRFFWLTLALAGPARGADAPNTFEDNIRPILKANCFECHGDAEKLKGGLDLRLKRLIAEGGESGPALVAGKPAESLILEKVRAGKMPPGKKKLSATEIERIEKWIAAGAKNARPEPESIAAGFHLTAEDRSYWAFQPVRRPLVPQVLASHAAVRNSIDAFLQASLREKGLDLSPPADRVTLIRRATFDLTGLPPTPEEVDAFLEDSSTDAYARLVDRLLASPHYGERWGRHWLDVAGYADSEGFSADDPIRSNAYKYRDYVIRAFNADKPFNTFIVEQVAGDELVNRELKDLSVDEIDKLTATGFLRMAADGTTTRGTDAKTARNQVVSDTIKIVSSSLFGLTVGCAQCHHHRYDPIPQDDYYRLRAILEPAYDVQNWRASAARQVSLYTDADHQKAKTIEAEAAKIDADRLKKQGEYIEATFQKELAKLPEEMREQAKTARNTPEAKRSAELKKLMREHPSLNVSAGSLYLYDQKAADELKKMADQAVAIRVKKPVEDFIRALTEIPGKVPATYLFHRGDPDQPKQAIGPGGLTILDEIDPLTIGTEASLRTSGRRLALARWLTDGKHPLTARVLVNRVWMHHFGRGIVGTPADFGRLGERPTHPELLDWLAADLVESGWTLKKLHKLIMTSAAYQQSSRRNPAADAIDPDNRLLHRMNLRRLEAEAVRDAVLAASGKLSRKAFGSPVPVREDEVGQIVVGKGMRDVARGITTPEPLPEDEEFRRSVYVLVRRTQPLGMLEAFDAATAEPNCEIRNASTVTPQSLMLMNSEFVLNQA